MKKEGCAERGATLFTFFCRLLFFGIASAAGAAFAAAASHLNAFELAIFAAEIVSATGYVATYRTIFFHTESPYNFIFYYFKKIILFLLTFLPF